MNEIYKFPFYAKLAFVLLSLISIFFIFYIGQGIIIPILMAILFSILLRPIMLFLKSKLRFPHILAVIVSVLLFVMFIVGIITFLSWQISDFVSDWDKIQTNIKIHIANIQMYVRDHFNISTKEQEEYINSATSDSLKSGKEMLGSTLMSFTDTLFNLALVPIYMFLLLLYRTHFIKFMCKLFKPQHHEKLQNILGNVKVAVKSYLVGLTIQLISVATLTSIGLSIVGVKYAILLGVITGILNLIPYVGIMFAYVISIFASLTGSPDLSLVIGVLVVNAVVQFIDNNILVPMVVSSKVEINAFVSIVGIIIGGSLAGVAGMFLAIPLIAILKVIFDRIEGLQAWGYLMGDDLPKTYEWRHIRLPLYNFENATDTINVNQEEVSKTIFTETTTGPDTKNE
ncbi:putative PurR-regulated permease PerM [Flavobacterium arsenatis]|uniref:PurR-regulated permease PerM n=1 Tax=Flavobacterium arsenatis TaxID=1484332 RepID=A0ABU1TRS1_9FLAO|nr:AI-2E family transporter [Flavobacterium arsenatis]MDR6968576.1 putative PurR-regulated permease PerM [Flavobacterium arsenatis]